MNQQQWNDAHDMPEPDHKVDCEECGQSILASEHRERDGLCDECIEFEKASPKLIKQNTPLQKKLFKRYMKISTMYKDGVTTPELMAQFKYSRARIYQILNQVKNHESEDAK